MKMRGKVVAFAVVVILLVILGVVPYAIIEFRSIEKLTLSQTTNDLRIRLNDAMSAKEDVWLTNALQLAYNPIVVQAMVAGDREAAAEVLDQYGELFKENTGFKNVQVHLIDADLRSFVKSWDTGSFGESLSYSQAYDQVRTTRQPLVTMEASPKGLRLKGLFPVMSEGRFIGIVNFEGGLNSIKRLLKPDQIDFLYVLKNEYLDIATSLSSATSFDGYTVSQSDVDEVFLDYVINRLDLDAARQQYSFDNEYLTVGVPVELFDGTEIGLYLIAQPRDVVAQILDQNLGLFVTLLTVFLVALLVLAAAAILVINRGVIRPLSEAMRAVQYVADGDLTAHVETKRKDEIGEMIRVVDQLSDRMRDVATNIRMVTKRVGEGSNSVGESAQGLSQGASEQAASVEETSASMQQITSQIQRNAENATETENISERVSTDAERTQSVVNEAVTSVRQIADRIGIIDEIARQTNLLALNAAIEASRAGEAGKGFAVVASEVRKLAERSQNAAAEITELSGTTMTTVENAGKTLQQLVPEIKKTAQLVQEIGAVSREQSDGSKQVNMAVQQLDQVIQGNASSSEELAATAEELQQQAALLEDTIAFFHGATDTTAEVAGVNFATIRFKHIQWKARLRGYLTGEAQISKNEAVSDHECALGQWYFGPGMENFGHLSAMQQIQEPHRRMHELVREIMALADRGEREKAQRALDELGPLSDRIVALLHEVETQLRAEGH